MQYELSFITFTLQGKCFSRWAKCHSDGRGFTVRLFLGWLKFKGKCITHKIIWWWQWLFLIIILFVCLEKRQHPKYPRLKTSEWNKAQRIAVVSIWLGLFEMHTILTDFATNLLSFSFWVSGWKWVYDSFLAYCAHLHITFPAQFLIPCSTRF